MPKPICRPEIITAPGMATRCQSEAERDGWRYAGTGKGLTVFVWDNAFFDGPPRKTGRGGPWSYAIDGVGCAVPGAVRWIGEYYAGPYLSRGVRFQLAVRADGGRCRLTMDGSVVASHGFGDPVGEVKAAGVNHEFVEVFTRSLDLPTDRAVPIVYEYAIERGVNLFGSKNYKDHVGRDHHATTDYSWMEVLSEDFCYPDGGERQSVMVEVVG